MPIINHNLSDATDDVIPDEVKESLGRLIKSLAHGEAGIIPAVRAKTGDPTYLIVCRVTDKEGGEGVCVMATIDCFPGFDATTEYRPKSFDDKPSGRN